MCAAVAREAAASAAPKKKQAAHVHPSAHVAREPVELSHTGPTLQRKAACACGGGCPRCAEEAEHKALQTKLRVSTPGDQYEQEADRVADAVLSMPEQRPATGEAPRAHAPSATHSGESVARGYTPSGGGVAAAPVDLVPGGGEPLAQSAKAFFEPRFGHDFGNVRIHTDARAAESARQMHALAYTFGRDIVFGAGMYEPWTPEGRKLLAHELTHVVQQGASRAAATGTVNRSAPLHVQRQAADPDKSGPCSDARIKKIIKPAFAEARKWRRMAEDWLEAHRKHVLARGARAKDGPVKVGQLVFDELMLLERHFRISDVLKVALPYTADDSVGVQEFNQYAMANARVLKNFEKVDLSISFVCQANCPRGKKGSDARGAAEPGKKEAIFYTNCYDGLGPTEQAGVALHEAFHASFFAFDHDTYSFEKNYPGRDPMTNAESHAVFASIVATGVSYRVPELIIRVSP